VIAFVLFLVVSTASVGGLSIYYTREPEKAEARLAELYARVVQLGPVLLAVLSWVVGLVLAFDGLSTLLS